MDKVYLPFARARHSSKAHAEFRCEVLKRHFAGKRFGEITVLTVVGFINQRLSGETVRRRVLEDGTKAAADAAPPSSTRR